jgi:hypothetical protein
VPQGSALGSLLFILYLNDLPNAVNSSQIRLFADDANNFVRNKNLINLKEEARSQLINITNWMTANKLTLNYDKTNFMIFTPKINKSDPDIFDTLIHDRHIFKRVRSTKYLGVIVDENLTWKEHIEMVATKLRRLSSIFYKVRKKIPKVALKQLYFALVHSAVQYGIEIYANTKKTYLEDLRLINNRILRIIQFNNMRTPIVDLYKSFQTLPINLLHDYKVCLFVYKYINCLHVLPFSFRRYFRFNLQIHAHYTRSCAELHIERFRNAFGKRSLHYRAVNIFNSLPADIKLLSSLNTFKKQVALYFISLI